MTLAVVPGLNSLLCSSWFLPCPGRTDERPAIYSGEINIKTDFIESTWRTGQQRRKKLISTSPLSAPTPQRTPTRWDPSLAWLSLADDDGPQCGRREGCGWTLCYSFCTRPDWHESGRKHRQSVFSGKTIIKHTPTLTMDLSLFRTDNVKRIRRRAFRLIKAELKWEFSLFR